MADLFGESPHGSNSRLGRSHIVHTLFTHTKGLSHHGIGIGAALEVELHALGKQYAVCNAVGHVCNGTDGVRHGVYITYQCIAESPSCKGGSDLHLASGNKVRAVLCADRQVTAQEADCMYGKA